jgi:acetylornithine deacetylase/succinyl-diaminopimelate desuccinylase-like protein
MFDENNRVTIPGFYDDVLPLSNKERALLTELPDTLLLETGTRNLWGDPAFTAIERVSARPTFEIHGIVGGYTDEGVKTVIPAKATAKISMRLVPNQNPDQIVQRFTDYVNSLTPDTISLKIRQQGLAGEPSIIDRDHPSIMAASNAYQAAFRRRPIFTREGGSIPVVSAFQHLLDLPVVMMGFGLTNDRLHSPNEKLHLPNFYRGIETSIHFMQEYARLKAT